MVIYLDSSALIRLYVQESDRNVVVENVLIAASLATSTLTYAEARAGLARRWREGDFTESAYRMAIADLDQDWNTVTRIQITDRVVSTAGDLAERHALRGSDAIQLASALRLAEETDNVHVMAFDQRLVGAVVRVGLPIITAPK